MGKSSLDAIAARVASSRDAYSSPISSRPRLLLPPDQFSFAKIGVPALFFAAGTDVIGRPAGWGRTQIEEWS